MRAKYMFIQVRVNDGETALAVDTETLGESCVQNLHKTAARGRPLMSSVETELLNDAVLTDGR
jgi:hypothetical protein